MIVSISSSLPSFKSMTFRRGLNIVLADTTNDSTEKQTRNSAGKTSLVEIIHFLLGSDADKASLFKKPEIIQHSFTAVIEIGGQAVAVTRSGSEDKRLLLGPNVAASLGIPFQIDGVSGDEYVTLEAWKAFLGNAWFDLPIERKGGPFEGTSTPSFRSLIGYFARRRKSGAYATVEKQNSDQQPWDWQVNLSYLIGLGWHVPRAMQDLRARKKTLDGFRKAIKAGEFGEMFDTSAAIRPELARTEEKLGKLKAQIAQFKVLDQYTELANEASFLKNRMSDTTRELFSVRETIRYLETSIREEKPPQYTAVERLYQSAGVELPEVALRRFDEVEAFQRSVAENRRRYLREQVEDAQRSAADLEAALGKDDERKSAILRSLDGKGAFEDLNHMHEDLATLAQRAENLREKLKNANVLENNLAQHKRENAELEMQLQEHHKANEEAIKDATIKVDRAIGELYDDRTGNLLITASKTGPKFGIEIQGGGNHGGIDMMKIFCFDMMLLQVTHARFGGPGFLIHDSHLFDGVDARQVRKALVFGAGVTESLDAQYLVAMNSDEFEKAEMSDDPRLQEAILPVRLTDDETGGLFGFRFD